MRHVVGVGDMKLSSNAGDIVVTHALGSCVGIAIHDPTVQLGGILHFMLPRSSVNPGKAWSKPYLFADTGIPSFFKEAFRQGATKKGLDVRLAGGAQILDDRDFFAVGKRNQTIARKLFWKNNVTVNAEHLGGHIARTLYLEIGTGRTWVVVQGQEIEL
ncbi:chemotaxis protein CheD [Candidatus Eisenbacteria bacterium]|uniref:Probable chemoreceptor glutamine deamidase CheD n=1 Tax=Eiseniibacteriota bacterium TaxID=2212470 RepID=A0ABV6YI19_UNCEI